MLGKILLAFMLAQAQNNAAVGTIRGHILVPSVQASERIQIIIQKSDGPVVARVFSDTLGNYEVRNLITGNYDVIVNVEGYEEARLQVGVSGGGAFNAVTANIVLREKEELRPAKPPAAAADEVVDVAELGRSYPKKATQDYEKALEEIRRGNDSKALALLLPVVKLAPDFYSAHNTLGTVLQRLSRYEDAEAEYQRARSLNPRSADPLVNLGSLYIDEAAAHASGGHEIVGKILDNALDILEEALKLKRSAMAYYLLGTAYYRSGFYEEAESNLKLALEMDPHLPSGLLMMSNLYIKQQKWALALENLNAYMAENPKAADYQQIQATRDRVAQRVP